MEPSVREPTVKRRKVRKGTRSCWECKGRKVKCTYMTPGDTVCDGCIRRGTSCISQELPEQPLAPVDRRRQIGNRMVRVEGLLERLVKETGDRLPVSGASSSESNGGSPLNTEDPTPSFTELGQTPYTASTLRPEVDALLPDSATTDTPDTPNRYVIDKPEASDLVKYQKLSKALLAVFPPQESVNSIVRIAGPIPSFFHQMVRTPYKDFRIGEKEKQDQVAELTIRHTPRTHPLIIARQMLLLAITFRSIHPAFQHDLKGFSEPPGIMMQRVAETAMDLITTNDKMIGTIEGLECLVLTSTFQADSGNLRAGWSATRRAMFLAQLMSLHRQTRPPPKSVQPGNRWDPQFLWYRIVYYDRFFSLILGLPQGCADNSMGSSSQLEHDTPMGRLERRHCVLAGRILQRNESDPSPDDLIDTQAIDMEIRKLSESMPSKWWLVPNLAAIQDGVELFWETVKVVNQVFHYILLSHLHLPFMLHSSSGTHQDLYKYSRIACVNASRDLLQRYMAFRTFNRVSYCCHSMDFFAITASMTLLLAHLDGHRCKTELDQALLHQRTSDRAIIEEILDNMEQVGLLNKANGLSERGAGELRRLLTIEADAVLCSSYRLERGDSHPNDDRALRLIIPYFGVITITNEADVLENTLQEASSRNSLSRAAPPKRPSLEEPDYGADSASAKALQQHEIQPASHEDSEQQQIQTDSGMRTADGADLAPSFQGQAGDGAQAQSFDSGLTVAGQDEWTFQGVDMTFFDALMRESDAQTKGSGDAWWLL
ncbi:Fc.00g094850.m01.CDS01 [Cosmosporella sp. VM-42]